MPDTKIEKWATGWVDVDVPGEVHRTRAEARAARRARKQGRVTAKGQLLLLPVSRLTSLPRGLENKLRSQLTVRGVADVQIDEMLASGLGYNAIASYGHMRQAGATHDEAKEVVERGEPHVSLNYGHARAAGLDHDAALSVS